MKLRLLGLIKKPAFQNCVCVFAAYLVLINTTQELWVFFQLSTDALVQKQSFEATP